MGLVAASAVSLCPENETDRDLPSGTRRFFFWSAGDYVDLWLHNENPRGLIPSPVKYLATILAFILVSLGLSWGAVFSFWYAAFLFRSVTAVRICDAIGAVVLLPVRCAFWLAGNGIDQSIPLSNPKLYAMVNAALLGILAYAVCRRLLFGKSSDGG